MAFVALLVACGGADEPAAGANGGEPADPTPTLFPTISADPSVTPVAPLLTGTKWVLTSLDGAPIDSGVTITLSFDDRAGRGNAGCNSYGGDYSADSSGNFAMPEIEATDADCPGEDVMEIESDYLLALSHVDTFDASSGQLELSHESGTTVLVFISENDVASAASPSTTSIPEVTITPTPDVSTPPSETPVPSPTMPFVDIAPLDDPGIDATVYWLGQRFEPGGNLPPLQLSFVTGPAAPGGGPADSRGELEYSSDAIATGIKLRLMRRADWDAWAARDPSGDDHARVLHMFWDSPCAQQEEIELDSGRAVIYSSYQALADPAVTECPDGPFDRFLAHVFIDDTVVLVNAPHFLEPPDMPSFQGAYNTFEGLEAVVRGLRPREPVAEPTPIPTPAASLDAPLSLLLQPADLPGRYGYGDDGCSPAYACNIGPGSFSSEGGYDDLQMAAGEFLAANVQYEHVGFTSSGTPDPSIEPPRIDSFALICVAACDPAAILDVSAQLLRYYGHSEATEIGAVPDIGDAALLYETSTLVLGQVTAGHAVVWRDGPVVGLVAVGGVTGEQGPEIAMDLAARQAERIRLAIGS